MERENFCILKNNLNLIDECHLLQLVHADNPTWQHRIDISIGFFLTNQHIQVLRGTHIKGTFCSVPGPRTAEQLVPFQFGRSGFFVVPERFAPWLLRF